MSLKNEHGQMAVETIFIMPLFILLFFAMDFFGKYSLEKQKLNMSARYAIWKVRETNDFSLPQCYNGITCMVKPSGIKELLPSNVATGGSDSLFLKIFYALANQVNDTKRIEVSSSVPIPGTLGFGIMTEVRMSESCVIDGSTWKISDIIKLLKKAFEIPGIGYGKL